MKQALIVTLLVLFVCSIGLAGDKHACAMGAKDASSKACAMKTGDAKACTVKDAKDCPMTPGCCTGGDKASVKKTSATKASVTKVSMKGQMDCCKMKNSEAKNTKARENSSGKGTN